MDVFRHGLDATAFRRRCHAREAPHLRLPPSLAAIARTPRRDARISPSRFRALGDPRIPSTVPARSALPPLRGTRRRVCSIGAGDDAASDSEVYVTASESKRGGGRYLLSHLLRNAM